MRTPCRQGSLYGVFELRAIQNSSPARCAVHRAHVPIAPRAERYAGFFELRAIQTPSHYHAASTMRTWAPAAPCPDKYAGYYGSGLTIPMCKTAIPFDEPQTLLYSHFPVFTSLASPRSATSICPKHLALSITAATSPVFFSALIIVTWILPAAPPWQPAIC